MVDITKFFIIKQDQFDSIIDYLNCTLSVNDPEYINAYILANIMGYICIIFTLWAVFTLVNKLFKENKMFKYWR